MCRSLKMGVVTVLDAILDEITGPELLACCPDDRLRTGHSHLLPGALKKHPVSDEHLVGKTDAWRGFHLDGGWSSLQSYTTGHHPEAMACTLDSAVRLEARATTAHRGGRCGLLGGYTYDGQKRA